MEVEGAPDLTDFMNDWFFGTVGAAKHSGGAYDLTGESSGTKKPAPAEKKKQQQGKSGGGGSNASKQTQEWLEEAKRMVGSGSPGRMGSPSRQVPRFAGGNGTEPTPTLDRRDPMSRSARRHRQPGGIGDEILQRASISSSPSPPISDPFTSSPPSSPSPSLPPNPQSSRRKSRFHGFSTTDSSSHRRAASSASSSLPLPPPTPASRTTAATPPPPMLPLPLPPSTSPTLLPSMDLMTASPASTPSSATSYKFVTDQAQSELQSPLFVELGKAVDGKKCIVCETVNLEFKEIVSMCGGPEEKNRASQLLKQLIIVPDNPSPRMMDLPTTWKLAMKNKVAFGTGDHWCAPTLTANMGFVRAVPQSGMPLLTIEHRPRALIGL